MRVFALTRQDYGANRELLTSMHRLRHRVFKDRLGWNVSVTNDMEIDTFDGLGPVYLLVVTQSQVVVGSARLLPTTGPYMLADTFPILLGGETAPRAHALLESSRFCVDTNALREMGSSGIHKATFMLLSAVIEWGLTHDAKGIVTVTDLRMERVLRRAGWPLTRFGSPKPIGVTTALAGVLEVSERVASHLRQTGGLTARVLTETNRQAA